jgi:hypothetical protein
MQSLRKITGAKTRRRIGTYGEGCMVCAPEDAEAGEDGL